MSVAVTTPVAVEATLVATGVAALAGGSMTYVLTRLRASMTRKPIALSGNNRATAADPMVDIASAEVVVDRSATTTEAERSSDDRATLVPRHVVESVAQSWETHLAAADALSDADRRDELRAHLAERARHSVNVLEEHYTEGECRDV